jgi:hypothetical protein
MASSPARPPRCSPVSTSIKVFGGLGWAAMMLAMSGSSVIACTLAPAVFSLAIWSSFWGVTPTV